MKGIYFMLKYFILIFICSILYAGSPAQARIDIVPQKIVFDSRDRNAELTVLNLLDLRGLFRIELVSFRQDENGIYQELEQPLDLNFNPKEIVRISPRQFSIEPGGHQKVRLSLRKPSDLPGGEYRFHVKAIRLAQEDERRAGDLDGVSVVANIGVTIPAIVRHGEVFSDAKLEDVQVISARDTKSGKPEMKLRIERSGNASTIGALEVFWRAVAGQKEQIGRIKNMNIFTDIDRRNVIIPLTKMPEGAGVIQVRYLDGIKKGHVFDEIDLPQ